MAKAEAVKTISAKTRKAKSAGEVFDEIVAKRKAKKITLEERFHILAVRTDGQQVRLKAFEDYAIATDAEIEALKQSWERDVINLDRRITIVDKRLSEQLQHIARFTFLQRLRWLFFGGAL